MSQENKATANRFLEEMFSEPNLRLADELFTPDHVLHIPCFPEEERGPDPMKGITWLFHKTMPGLEVVLEDQIAEGDTVASRWTLKGALADRLQTNGAVDEVTVSGISFFRVDGAQIAETWLNLGADPDWDQAPMPDDDIQNWLTEDDESVGQVTFSALPEILEPLKRMCCWLRICCK